MGIDLRPNPPTQADGTPLQAFQGRVGKEVIYATHNLCDPSTWYSESIRVVDQTLTKVGSVWESGNVNWVDMVHGKVFGEDGISEDQKVFEPGDPHGYEVVVTVDAVPKTQQEPFGSGGDYTIDYALGTIAPVTENWTGKTIVATYSYSSGSGWVMTPLPGKALIIEKAEIQFSKNIDMSATFVMEVFGLVDIFAPHLLDTADPPGPFPSGTKIPIETNKYKTLDQIVDEAVAAFPEIPVMGGSRGFTSPRHVFQFHYAAVRTIWSSLGMHIRVSIEGGDSFGGERATATFYCTSQIDGGISQALKILMAE